MKEDTHYRIIFIDDEYIVREGIKTRINWGENGFDLIGVFENGKEALQFLKNKRVDVIISDIYMPQMDGLELSRIVHREYPETIVIILTGYDEFEYAQQAIRYRVKEFLLKPITAEEMEGILKKVREELDKQRETKEEIEILKETAEKSLPVLKEQLLRDIIHGTIGKKEIEERKKLIKWDIPINTFFKVATIFIPREIKKNTRSVILKWILAESLKTLHRETERFEAFFNYDNCIVVVFMGAKRNTLEQHSSKIEKEIFEYIKNSYGIHTFIGSGNIVHNITNLHTSYNEAKNAMEYARILGLSSIMPIREVKNRNKLLPNEYFSMIRKIGESLYSGNRKETKEAIEDIFSYIKQHYLTSEEITVFYAQLQFFLNSFIQEIDLVPMDIQNKTSETNNLRLKSKSNFSNFDADNYKELSSVKEYFLELVEKIEEMMDQRRNNLITSRIARAKRIIKQRYSDPDFTLKEMADELFLSVSQFSTIFKEGTGKTFVEYLTEVRLKEAKKLLKQTDLMVYEIAEKVGFNDPHYFSIAFKKHTGMRPGEYRKNLEAK